jgi:macrolide transport system ATP-binding/permease protein
VGALPVAISARIIAVAVVSSAGVGLFFGFYPARCTSLMNPIDALRVIRFLADLQHRLVPPYELH